MGKGNLFYPKIYHVQKHSEMTILGPCPQVVCPKPSNSQNPGKQMKRSIDTYADWKHCINTFCLKLWCKIPTWEGK